jgi:hypothetical protein
MRASFWSGNLMGRDNLKDLDADEKIILKRTVRKPAVGGLEWIHLAQDRDRWRAVVNAVMNFRVP